MTTETITNFTNSQLTGIIKNLATSKFTNRNALNSYISEVVTLKCDWDGLKYNTHVYLERVNNPDFEYCITVGTDSFPYNEEGIKEAVNYINN